MQIHEYQEDEGSAFDGEGSSQVEQELENLRPIRHSNAFKRNGSSHTNQPDSLATKCNRLFFLCCLVTVAGIFTYQHQVQNSLKAKFSKFEDTASVHSDVLAKLEQQVKELEQQMRLDRDHFASQYSKKDVNLQVDLSKEIGERKAEITKNQALPTSQTTPQNTGALATKMDSILQQSSKINTDTVLTVQLLSNQARELFYEDKMARYFRYKGQTKFLKEDGKARDAMDLLSLNYRTKYMHAGTIDKMKAKEKAEYSRLSKMYPFHKEQLGFCIVVPTMNNAKNYRYEYNLQSIYNLNYDPKKVRVVIIDDASTDRTADLIQQFLNQNPPAFNFSLIRHQERTTALPGIHAAIMNYCDKKDIVMFADGDDQLINPWILKVYNSVYQNRGANVVYSDHIKIDYGKNDVLRGWSRQYPQKTIDTNTYRQNGLGLAHLRSFRAHLYHHIREQDLKDSKGKWFTSNYDDAIFNPILELSCGKIQYLKGEYFYLYNFGIGSNDWLTLTKQMQQNIKYIKKMKKYQCLKESQ